MRHRLENAMNSIKLRLARRPRVKVRLSLFSKLFIILLILSLNYTHDIYKPSVAMKIEKAKVVTMDALKKAGKVVVTIIHFSAVGGR